MKKSESAKERQHTELLARPVTSDSLPDNWATLLQDRARVQGMYGDLLKRAEEARTHPAPFTEFVMRTERGHQRLKVTKHQQILFDFMWKHPRCVVILPIGHSKTFALEALGLYRIGIKPPTRGAVVSATQAQAKKLLAVMKEYITIEPNFRLVFPKCIPSDTRQWTDSQFTVQRPPGIKDPTMAAFGVDGGITGSRIDFCIVDDLLNRQNTATKEQRDKIFEFFDSTVLSRLEPDGQIVVSNSAWHADDLLHRLEALGWAVLRMQVDGAVYVKDDAIRIEAGEEPWDHELLVPADDAGDAALGDRLRIAGRTKDDALWHEMYPDGLALIKALRDKHPITSEFNRLFMGVVRDNNEAMCKSEWIELCKKNARDRGIFHMVQSLKGGETYTGVDLAFSKKDSADFTVIFTFNVLPSGHRQVLDIQSGKWSAPEIKRRILDVFNRYDSVVRVENNAAQVMLVDILADENPGIPIKGHTTGNNKANPMTGVHSVFNDMAHGLWLIPNDEHSGRCHPEVQKWVDGCLYYTPEGHTSDQLMACLAPGVLVTTSRGLVPIELVEKGELVLTHKSRWRTVTGVTVYDHDAEAVRIKASGHLPMLATLNHPVWSATAKHIRDGTNRLVPNNWEFRLTEELKVGRKTKGMFVFSPVPSAWPVTAATRIDMAAYTTVRELRWGGRWHIGETDLIWSNQKRYPRWLDIDVEFAMMIGLYLAEGSVGGTRHQVVFSLHERETVLRHFIEDVSYRAFSADCFWSRQRPGYLGRNIHLSSVLAARFFQQLGKYDVKAMPWEWMSWPIELRMAVVRGWLMGDGCLTGTPRPRLSGVSISRPLLEQMRLTLLEAGYLPSMGAFMHAGPRMFGGKSSSCRNSWKLSLSESDSSRLLNGGNAVEREHWGWTNTKARVRTNSGLLRIDGGAAVRLSSLERCHYRGPVHNLHVDGDESYIANGIAVHNSWFAREQAREYGALIKGPSNGQSMGNIGNLLSR